MLPRLLPGPGPGDTRQTPQGNRWGQSNGPRGEGRPDEAGQAGSRQTASWSAGQPGAVSRMGHSGGPRPPSLRCPSAPPLGFSLPPGMKAAAAGGPRPRVTPPSLRTRAARRWQRMKLCSGAVGHPRTSSLRGLPSRPIFGLSLAPPWPRAGRLAVGFRGQPESPRGSRGKYDAWPCRLPPWAKSRPLCSQLHHVQQDTSLPEPRFLHM